MEAADLPASMAHIIIRLTPCIAIIKIIMFDPKENMNNDLIQCFPRYEALRGNCMGTGAKAECTVARRKAY